MLYVVNLSYLTISTCFGVIYPPPHEVFILVIYISNQNSAHRSLPSFFIRQDMNRYICRFSFLSTTV